jgi:hypothetical protein
LRSDEIEIQRREEEKRRRDLNSQQQQNQPKKFPRNIFLGK